MSRWLHDIAAVIAWLIFAVSTFWALHQIVGAW